MIDNLKQFNSLQYQRKIHGNPLPTSFASFSAAQFCMCWPNSSEEPQKANGGIYLAKIICKQANHMISYREFPQSRKP